MESSVGLRIKRLRKDLGLTQGDLAGDQLSRAMLSLIERDLTTPSLRTIEYLSHKLGVSVGDLLGEIKDTSVSSTTSEDIKKSLNICTTLYKVKKYKEAESRLKELITIEHVPFPEKWLAHKLLGQIYEKLDEDEKALIHFKESLFYLSSTDTNEIVEVYYYKTLSNRKLGNYKDGIAAALNAAVLIESYHTKVDSLLQIKLLYNLALCYCRVKEFQKGLDVINKAIGIMEVNEVTYSNGHFYMLKGLAELYMNKFAEGIVSTRGAIKYLNLHEQPERYLGSRINLGILLRKHNKIDESLKELHECLDEALKADVPRITVNNYYELALSYLYMENMKQAEYFAKCGLALAKPRSHLHGQCHYVLGKVLMKLGNYKQALTEIMKSESIFQSQKNESWVALVMSEKAICYANLNEYKNAFQFSLLANQMLLKQDMRLISTEIPVMS
ncbi:helix-turn-helix domain-containing protein [Pseudalkalibacillus salsuginis]|uniref:helix-turn-helix domain-containing protein n=1 Tax=Pseudalkalibacillus salsuginis TaxID=2910972 RepID=UPI001F29D73E|nr:helix-turn-helix domain-containing protein [Pseudalkalibacillus salsuginis]MCF6409947.1 helix-turn-helix domain-containing protein [Pseudalkalibacillus salsuginis]